MDPDRLHFIASETSREYIVSFGSLDQSLHLPDGLAIRYRTRRRLKEGDVVAGGFRRPPLELVPQVEAFCRLYPHIFHAKIFKVTHCLGEHLIFLSPH